ncbi:MAG: YaaL family protein [Clostridiales bacterium]|nr:YaaL family protein [Clostridiales bacterium]
MSAITASARPRAMAEPRKVEARDIKRRDELAAEERELVQILDSLKKSLSELYAQFGYMTDAALIDACAYEILSVSAKYAYYLRRCKERKICAV